MRVPHIARLVRLRRMTVLQEQVTAMKVCSDCHARTLIEIGSGAEGRWLQCSRCRRVFADPPAGSITPG